MEGRRHQDSPGAPEGSEARAGGSPHPPAQSGVRSQESAGSALFVLDTGSTSVLRAQAGKGRVSLSLANSARFLPLCFAW